MAPFPPDTYLERIERARAGMHAAGIELLVLPPSGDLEYLTGLSISPSERLVALLLPLKGAPRIICPAFEGERILQTSAVTGLVTWQEHQDPFIVLRGEYTQISAVSLGATTPYGFAERIRAVFPDPVLTSASSVLAPLRAQKSDEEVAAIGESQEQIRTLILEVADTATPGQTEESLSRDLGGGTVLFGANTALPHGTPGYRPLFDSDIVLIDAGTRVRGYHSDLTRTFLVRGEDRLERVWRIVLEAQSAAAAAARPGVEARAVDRAAREVIREAGYRESFIHRTGHGIGLDGHEPPYLVEGNRTLLQAGMTVTLEPGIYLPGEFGIRIEDVFLIAEGGCEPLSPIDRDPMYRR